MINRRELMASGVAATLLAPLSLASVRAGSQGACSVFVSDERIPEAMAAAHESETLGATTLPLGTDVTAIYEWLDLSLREAPKGVAGLTTSNALFVIERLAWDRGLRTVYRGMHQRVLGRLSSLELVGAPNVCASVRSIAGAHFGRDLGLILAGVRPGPSDYPYVVTSQHVPRPDDTAFVSWLLAPRDQLRTRGVFSGDVGRLIPVSRERRGL
jgi:hypothetical protein